MRGAISDSEQTRRNSAVRACSAVTSYLCSPVLSCWSRAGSLQTAASVATPLPFAPGNGIPRRGSKR